MRIAVRLCCIVVIRGLLQLQHFRIPLFVVSRMSLGPGLVQHALRINVEAHHVCVDFQHLLIVIGQLDLPCVMPLLDLAVD